MKLQAYKKSKAQEVKLGLGLLELITSYQEWHENKLYDIII